MNLPFPKLVIFDWDNTLVSSWHKLHESINHVMRSFGKEEWSMAKVMSTMHKSSRDFFPNVFMNDSEKARETFYEYYNSHFNEMASALEGAEQTLQELQKLGIKMAIISNKIGRNLRSEIKVLGWDKYFDSILGASDLADDKPSKLVVEHTLIKLDLLAGQHIWFVGDTIIDMQCAINTDCFPIFFGEQIDDAPHPKDSYIEHIHVLNHKRLLELIKDLKEV